MPSQIIYKYPVKAVGDFEIQMPEGSRILSLQVQRKAGVERPMLWALCPPGAAPIKRRFRGVLTGEVLENSSLDAGRFIGTFQIYGGDFVVHVFEVTP